MKIRNCRSWLRQQDTQRSHLSYALCTDRRGGVVRIITATCTASICHYYYYLRRPMTGGSEISSITLDRTVVYKHKSRANIAEPWQSYRDGVTSTRIRQSSTFPSVSNVFVNVISNPCTQKLNTTPLNGISRVYYYFIGGAFSATYSTLKRVKQKVTLG